MMTGKSLVTGLGFLMAVSVLASCGPQKRAPDIKSTKLGNPAPATSAASQVQGDKQNISGVNVNPGSLAPAIGPVVSNIKSIVSSTMTGGLLLKLQKEDDSVINVKILDNGKAESEGLNTTFKCADSAQVAADCNDLTVTLQVPTLASSSKGAALENKTMIIQRRVLREMNVTRSLGGKEEVQGAAIVEAIRVSSEGKDKIVSEAKAFINAEVIGTDLLRVKKQLSGSVSSGNTVYNIAVFGLPEKINGVDIVYEGLGETVVENGSGLEFTEKVTGMRIKISYTTKFDKQKDYKAPTVTATAGDEDAALANQTVANPIDLKAEEARRAATLAAEQKSQEEALVNAARVNAQNAEALKAAAKAAAEKSAGFPASSTENANPMKGAAPLAPSQIPYKDRH